MERAPLFSLYKSAVFLFCLTISLMPTASFAETLTDTQKEAIESIREIVMQLMLLGVGVFSFVGGLIAQSSKKFCHVWMMWVSLIGFAISFVIGYLAFGGLTYDLLSDGFNPADNVSPLALWQFIFFGIAGLLLLGFLLLNLDKRGE